MITDPSTCLLAQISRSRRVEQRQQTVLLFWDGRCVCLERDAFACLNRLLATGVMELELTRLREGKLCLEQHPVGHFHLHLEPCCLILPLLDFLNLVQLVRAANRRLSSEARPVVPSVIYQ
jgi:hypothetical protein